MLERAMKAQSHRMGFSRECGEREGFSLSHVSSKSGQEMGICCRLLMLVTLLS